MKAARRLCSWAFWDSLLLLLWIALFLMAAALALAAPALERLTPHDTVFPALGVVFLWVSAVRALAWGTTVSPWGYALGGQAVGSVVALAYQPHGRPWKAIAIDHALMGAGFAILLGIAHYLIGLRQWRDRVHEQVHQDFIQELLEKQRLQ
jgi:hypothetical protein